MQARSLSDFGRPGSKSVCLVRIFASTTKVRLLAGRFDHLLKVSAPTTSARKAGRWLNDQHKPAVQVSPRLGRLSPRKEA